MRTIESLDEIEQDEKDKREKQTRQQLSLSTSGLVVSNSPSVDNPRNMKSTETNPIRRTALHYLVNVAIIVIFLLIIFNFLPVVT